MIQFLAIMLNARRDEEKGATAVEYGLMVALIAIVIIVAVTLSAATSTDSSAHRLHARPD